LHLQGVSELFQQALSDKLLVVNPVLGIRQRKVARPVSETPTREQFRAIVQSIRSQNLADTREESADFVEFLGLAGLGLAEASALTWANVSLDKGQMVIFRHNTKQGFVIPIYPQLRPLMEKRFTPAKALNAAPYL
jgi:integrase